MPRPPRDLTPNASVRHFFGAELRRLRERANLSQSQLGKLVNYSDAMIAAIEKAVRWPTPQLANTLDHALDTDGTFTRLLPLVEAQRQLEGRLGEAGGGARDEAGAARFQLHLEMLATEVCDEPLRATTRTGEPAADPSGAVLIEASAADALSRALMRRRITRSTVGSLQDLVHIFRRLDDEVGPQQLLGPVTGTLTWVSTKLAEAERHDAAFQGLCAVAAELSQLVGWLSFDMNGPAAARRHLGAAHRAAVAAGDAALAAYALGWKSIVVGQHDARAGLQLALAAQHQCGPDAAPSVVAWLTRVEAEALAASGDRAGSERALERVAAAAAMPRTQRDPSWTYFISEGQIAAYRGVCFVRLGQGHRAEAALQDALEALPGTFTRDRCLYMTYLAAAHVLQDQPDVAASVAAAAFELAVATDSPRSVQRLRDLRRDLDRWESLSRVQELDDLMMAY